MSGLSKNPGFPITTISSLPEVNAEWRVDVLEERAEFTQFTLTGPENRSLTTRISVIGRHMAANAGLAIVMLVEAGFELEAIGHALDRDGGIVAFLPGRIERVSHGDGPAVYVDYGHSPDAFSTTMGAIRKFTTGKLIMVFGADGDRDASKRIEMGRIGSEQSDVLIITDYNPRFEDAAAIRSTLLEGAATAQHPAEVHEVASQAQAIRLALSIAACRRLGLVGGSGARGLHRCSRREDSVLGSRRGTCGLARGRLGVIELSLEHIESTLAGRLVLRAGGSADSTVGGEVHTDSRRVVEGSLFFALPGEVTDGHLFAPKAVENGAVLLVVERELDLDVDQIVVADGVAALADLARDVVARVRARGQLRVVAVTGSNGKTTTKNMLHTVLQAEGPTIAPRESFNNHVGAPISMLAIDVRHRFLVVEMGASAIGEIAQLVSIVMPDVGDRAQGRAGSRRRVRWHRDAVERAKSEMVTRAAAIRCRSPECAMTLESCRMAELTAARVEWFGLADNADVRATTSKRRQRARRSHLKSTAMSRARAVAHSWRAPRHERARDDRGDPGARRPARSHDRRARDRSLERSDGAWRCSRATTVSSSSTTRTTRAPTRWRPRSRRSRRSRAGDQRSVAVLGEMAELGEYADDEHDRIGRLAVRLNIRKLIVVGHNARHIHNAAGLEGSWDGESVLVATADEAYDVLRDELRYGDVVLVKSSGLGRAAIPRGSDRRGVRVIALLIAGGFALAFTLFLTPLFIRLFTRLKWGQFIRDDGPQSHHTKRGTPTMGGIVFILGATIGYFVGHAFAGEPLTLSGLLVIYLMVGLGIDRVHRRLPQDAQPAQPRPRRLVEDPRAGHRRRRIRGPRAQLSRRGRAHSGLIDDLGDPRRALARPRCVRSVARRHPVRDLGDPDHRERVERRERRRRPRRPRVGRRDLRDLGLHLHRLLAVQPVVLQVARIPKTCTAATKCATRSTSRSSRPRSRARSSASCGGTPRPPRSSWATRARWGSAARSRPSRSSAAPSCLLVLIGGLFLIVTGSVILQRVVLQAHARANASS